MINYRIFGYIFRQTHMVFQPVLDMLRDSPVAIGSKTPQPKAGAELTQQGTEDEETTDEETTNGSKDLEESL